MSTTLGRLGFPLKQIDLCSAGLSSVGVHFSDLNASVVAVSNSVIRSLNALSGAGAAVDGVLHAAPSRRFVDSIVKRASQFVGSVVHDAVPGIGRFGDPNVDGLVVDASMALGCDNMACIGSSVGVSKHAHFDSVVFDDVVFEYAGKSCSALPIVSELVALPKRAATVDLLSNLPSEIAAAYGVGGSVLSHALLASTTAAAAPRARRANVFGARSEYVRLLRRMLDIGMINFTDNPKAINGLFCVPKPDGTLRLILNAKPANDLFGTPPHVQLSTPDVVAGLAVPNGKRVFVGKTDLSDMYHSVRMPEAYWDYFALPAVRLSELGMESEKVAWPCIVTMPMGWAHAVFLAQTMHLHIVERDTYLRSENLVRPGVELSLLSPKHVIYVDDAAIFSTSRALVCVLQANYMKAMRAAGFSFNLSKWIQATDQPVAVVGHLFDGRALTFGVAPVKLRKLQLEIAHIISVGACTGVDIERVVGKLTWAMLIKRPALSVFSAVYKFARSAGDQWTPIWSSVRNELVVASGLLPLLNVSLDSVWFNSVLAVDASNVGQGVVATDWSDDAFRARAVKSGKQSLPTVRTSSVCDHESDGISCLRWRRIVSAPWKWPSHINCSELRALRTAVTWCASAPWSIGKKLLVFSDSVVVVSAVSKGRSSSYSLLNVIRPLASLLLAADIRLVLAWIPSHVNPADAASRLFV
jgi:hypothetical protein